MRVQFLQCKNRWSKGFDELRDAVKYRLDAVPQITTGGSPNHPGLAEMEAFGIVHFDHPVTRYVESWIDAQDSGGEPRPFFLVCTVRGRKTFS
jgi:hypothetical protein